MRNGVVGPSSAAVPAGACGLASATKTKKKKTATATTKRAGKRKSSALPLDQLPVAGGVDQLADGAVGSVSNALGSVANNAVNSGGGGGGGGGKSDTLRLRLDLNLDVEITLKAKIHGDLELALLTG
ncbi:hypothetical protein CDD83_3187 [Cordyceps sp. RAO-2017]|nr:hypothetical protein CDD83_3187 [Cordyceps sp. RAO-2017]